MRHEVVVRKNLRDKADSECLVGIESFRKKIELTGLRRANYPREGPGATVVTCQSDLGKGRSEDS